MNRRSRLRLFLLVCLAALFGGFCAQTAMVGVLAMVAVPSYTSAIKHAREAVLKEDLHALRAAIDFYTADKQKAPKSLDVLLQDGYLKSIPVDPMTRSSLSWVTDSGIHTIHSGSDETGSDGQPYNTW